MPEQNKRIIVEGVAYSQLFQFPRILKAVASALQPARMVIALLMVTALITFGQLWDGIVARSAVSPEGITSGRWDEEAHGPPHQAALRNAAVQHGLSPAPNDVLETPAILRAMAASYEHRRAALATPEAQLDFDVTYVQTLRDIQATRPRGVYEATEAHVVASVRQVVQSVLEVSVPGVHAGLEQLLVSTPRLLWKQHTAFTVVYGLFVIIVFAVGGGAISRIAAMQTATQQRLGVREAIDFSMRRLGALVMAQLLPLVILLLLCAAVVVMGVLMAAPVLDVIGGLLYGLALVLGFLIAFLIVGYIAGHPMLIPAVACENCSGADAMQRSYAYTATRPLHLLGYWALSVIGMALGLVLVSIFAVLMLNGTASLYGTLNSNSAMLMAGGHGLLDLSRPTAELPLGEWHHRWAGGLIGFWETAVICLVAAYVLAYHFSAATAVYLLMRRAADGQDIEEIWQHGFVPGTAAPAPA